MIFSPEIISKFDWKDLHGKILHISVAEPDPENLEMLGQVFARDVETHKIYVLAEYKLDGSPAER